LKTTGILLIFLFAISARAMDSAEVLPKGINSPSVRVGYISGIAERYSSQGNLQSLGDTKALAFDAKTLVKTEPQLKQLVSVLNQFGQQALGDKLSLGYLKFKIEPTVNYYAPVYARGMTERWTLAVGAPVIHYSNQVRLEATGSNIDAIHAQVGHQIPELNSAFDQLHVSLQEKAQQRLVSLGYKPLGKSDETYLGDVQLASLYQFYKSDSLKLLSKTLIGLPTGPEQDPNDLASLDVSGQTSLEQQIVLNYRVLAPLTLATKAYYHYNFSDKVDRRVPLDANDSLPGPDQNEKIDRKLGDSVGASVSATYLLLSRLSLSAGLDAETRGADRYSGGRGYDYQILSEATNTAFERTKFGIAYSTIESYFKQESMLPFVASFEYSDVISGENMPRITTSELWLTLFF
jgi:hypothetical protein